MGKKNKQNMSVQLGSYLSLISNASTRRQENIPAERAAHPFDEEMKRERKERPSPLERPNEEEDDQLRHAGQKPVFLPVLFSPISLSLFSVRRPATIAKDRECHGEEGIQLQEEVSPSPCCGSRRYKPSLCSLLMELSGVGKDSAQVADTPGQ